MNIAEKIKKKYSWLTWSLFAELYWYYVIGMILPAALIDSTLLLFLVFLAIICLMVMTWKDEVKERKRNALQYLYPDLKGNFSEQMFEEIEINYKPIIRNTFRDSLKYLSCGIPLYLAGKILDYLFTQLGFVSQTLTLLLKISATLFIVSLIIANICLFILWALPRIFNWAITKE